MIYFNVADLLYISSNKNCLSKNYLFKNIKNVANLNIFPHKSVKLHEEKSNIVIPGLFLIPGTDATVSQSLLTQQGVAVVSLSNGKTYCFNSSLETW